MTADVFERFLFPTGIFILISTGILWDTMSPHYEASPRPSAEVATAPREDDDPPPDYDSVVRGDTTKPTSVSRSNSKCVNCLKVC